MKASGGCVWMNKMIVVGNDIFDEFVKDDDGYAEVGIR